MAKRKKPTIDRRADLFAKFMHIESPIIQKVEWMFDDVTGNFDIHIIGNAQVKNTADLKNLIYGITAAKPNSNTRELNFTPNFFNKVFVMDMTEEDEDEDEACNYQNVTDESEDHLKNEPSDPLYLDENDDGATIVVDIGVTNGDVDVRSNKKILIIKHGNFSRKISLSFEPIISADSVSVVNGIATIKLQRKKV